MLVACGRSADTRAPIARADTLLRQSRYADALVESGRALRANPTDPAANRVQGLAQLELGKFAQAYQSLLKAVGADTRDITARLAIASIYLIDGNAEQAREQGLTVLQHDSSNALGALITATTAATAAEMNDARQRLTRVNSTHSGVQAVVDAERRRLRDDTVGARSALAAFARAATPADRIRRARLLVAAGQRALAKDILAAAADGTDSSLAAERYLAELQLGDGDAASALRTINRLLQHDSNDVEALLQRGRLRIAGGEVDSGAHDIQRVGAARADLAPVRYALASAELQRAARSSSAARDSARARARDDLVAAIDLLPGYPEATLGLAEFEIARGRARAAITTLDRFVRTNPRSVRGHRVLGAALTANGRTAEAAEEFQTALSLAPSRPEGHVVIGMTLLDAKQDAAARREFEQALDLGSMDALAQLVNLDLVAGQADSAIARVQSQVARSPRAAEPHNLLGQVQLLRGAGDAAEAEFLKAIQLDPHLADARLRLADLYEMTSKPDAAIAQVDTVMLDGVELGRAKTLLGIARQQRGDVALAQQSYEDALRIDPRSPAAANNLALLLADQPAESRRALELAGIARQAAPNDPHVADTYGWALFKNGRAEEALKILKECAAKLPSSPAVAYHLGMVARTAGDEALARASLTKAVNAAASFPGKDEARQALARLR